jgi:hypothetical protein
MLRRGFYFVVTRDVRHAFAFRGLTNVSRTVFDFPPLAKGGYLCAAYYTVAKVNNPKSTAVKREAEQDWNR